MLHPSTLPSWPCYSPPEVEACAAVLRSGQVNYWTGREGKEFEREYAAYLGVPYAVAVANGTVALELGLRALGIGPGDEVITSSRTFIASASSVVAVGARPRCADVDPVSQDITAETIQPLITPRTRAIIAVHLGGWPCDMDSITSLAREHGLKVIEDCAQAHGATYKGKPVGSFGDAAAFSFCQDKVITTGGEGGLLALKERSAWESAWAYKDHGKSWAAVHRENHPPGFRWLHESFGTNWRMTEMQAAIGRIQLRRLDEMVALRRRNAGILSEGLKDLPGLRLTLPTPEIGHAYYRYYAFVRPDVLRKGRSRESILGELAAAGIPCSVGSCAEIYREKAFRETQRPPRPHPVAQQLGENSLAFLVHPTLQPEHMKRIAQNVRVVIQSATA